jgi:hypothetical protein
MRRHFLKISETLPNGANIEIHALWGAGRVLKEWREVHLPESIQRTDFSLTIGFQPNDQP